MLSQSKLPFYYSVLFPALNSPYLLLKLTLLAHLTDTEHKLPPGQNPDEWTIREKLTLASSVVRSGDQNW